MELVKQIMGHPSTPSSTPVVPNLFFSHRPVEARLGVWSELPPSQGSPDVQL